MKNKPKSEHVVSEKFILQLYITGMSENSMRAIENITLFCERYLKDHFDLQIIDIYKDSLQPFSHQAVSLTEKNDDR